MGRNVSSLVPTLSVVVIARSALIRGSSIDPHEPNKVELKKGHAENAVKTARILKPEEIFDLASFNRYRYRNIFNVRY